MFCFALTTRPPQTVSPSGSPAHTPGGLLVLERARLFVSPNDQRPTASSGQPRSPAMKWPPSKSYPRATRSSQMPATKTSIWPPFGPACHCLARASPKGRDRATRPSRGRAQIRALLRGPMGQTGGAISCSDALLPLMSDGGGGPSSVGQAGKSGQWPGLMPSGARAKGGGALEDCVGARVARTHLGCARARGRRAAFPRPHSGQCAKWVRSRGGSSADVDGRRAVGAGGPPEKHSAGSSLSDGLFIRAPATHQPSSQLAKQQLQQQQQQRQQQTHARKQLQAVGPNQTKQSLPNKRL